LLYFASFASCEVQLTSSVAIEPSSALITLCVGIFTLIAFPLAICFGFLFFGGFDGGYGEQFMVLLRTISVC
jgi:hypothetical protein